MEPRIIKRRKTSHPPSTSSVLRSSRLSIQKGPPSPSPDSDQEREGQSLYSSDQETGSKASSQIDEDGLAQEKDFSSEIESINGVNSEDGHFSSHKYSLSEEKVDISDTAGTPYHSESGASVDKSSDRDVKNKTERENGRKTNGVTRISRKSHQKLERSAKFGKSQIMKAKCDKLLDATKAKYSKDTEAFVEKTTRALKTMIEEISPEEASSIVDAETRLRRLHNIVIPFPKPRPPAEAKYKLGFAKPANINVTGSYALKTALQQEGPLAIDLFVTMPSSLFTEKDFLNYRYFHKRAYYLARIAARIQSSTLEKTECLFSYHNGNPLHPIITVHFPKQSTDGSLININILLAVEMDTFALAKTLPNKNSVRSIYRDVDQENMALSSSSFYNASIRSDSVVTSYLKLLNGISKRCEAFRDACILGSIWLKQRGFSSSISDGGYGHFEWAVTMASLFEGDENNLRPALLPSYSVFQIFCVTLRFLAVRNLARSPLLGGMNTLADDRDAELPMMFDGERGLNFLYKMSPWSYHRLQYEAQQSLIVISNSTLDSFTPLFATKVEEPLLKYDLSFQMHEGACQRSDLPHIEAWKAFEVLRKGLGQRVDLLNIKLTKPQPWSVNTARPKRVEETAMTIEMQLDLKHAEKAVLHGPSADEVTATAIFKEFWGDKAELRRFSDGSIKESVVLEGKTAREKTIEIVRHLFALHMPPKASESLVVLGIDIVKTLRDLGVKGDELVVASLRARAVGELEAAIRGLEDLPLAIREVKFGGSELTDLSSDKSSVTNVFVQFEGSGKWPRNLSAIQVTKTAFLLRIREQLSKSTPKFGCQLGLENEFQETVNKSFLDVRHPSGVTLRVRIHHEHELFLIQDQLKDKSSSVSEKELAAEALSEYKRHFLETPLQQQAIQALSTRLSAFLPTLALTKAWFNAHLLSWHLKEPLIEIIVAHSFVYPHPWKAPSTPIAGFLRTLAFLAQWNWQENPLIVDFNNVLNVEQRNDIHAKFAAWRSLDPLMNRVVLFAGTTFDHDGTTWTKGSPPKVVAARMTSLAKASCRIVYSKGVDLQLEMLFKSSLKEYDFVIQLSHDFTDRRADGPAANHSNKYKNLELSMMHDELSPTAQTLAVNYFLRELRALYGNLIIFFHNRNGGEYIAGIWNPEYEKRNWKVNLTYSTIALGESHDQSDEGGAVINKRAILGEIARVGGDMISSISVNK